MKKVLCPGEALIDFVAVNSGNDLKKSNEFLKKAGGAPANAAGAMVKFGIDAHFTGVVGKDAFGDFLIDTLRNYQINVDLLFQDEKLFTTLAFVTLDEDGDRDFEFSRSADQALEFSKLINLDQYSCFHFASATAFLGGSLEDTYFKLLEYANDNNVLVTFDANYRDALFGSNKEKFINKSKEFIGKSDIVKLSEEEVYLISGEEDVKQGAEKLKKLGCEWLVVTLGANGCYLICDELIHISSDPIKMVDATGAGDAFIGSLVAQVINLEEELTKNKMIEIIKVSSKIGALTTTKHGALESIPSLEEVKS